MHTQSTAWSPPRLMLATRSQTGFFGVRVQAPAPCVCPARAPLTIEAAHKKGGGSTKNGRDSNGQRRGVKVYGGQPVKAGGIIVRQVGCKVLSASVALSRSPFNYAWLLCCQPQAARPDTVRPAVPPRPRREGCSGLEFVCNAWGHCDVQDSHQPEVQVPGGSPYVDSGSLS